MATTGYQTRRVTRARSIISFKWSRSVRPTTDSTISPALEQQQRRNAADAEPAGRVGILVHVELAYGEASVEVGGHRIHGRRKPAARAAPLRPEIDENRAIDLITVESKLPSVRV